MRKIMIFPAGLILVLLLSGTPCIVYPETGGQEGGTLMTLSSSVFENGGFIPSRYSCRGEDVSPPLSWSSVPAGTVSLALVCDDPDAPMGTWVHWVVYNIPPESGSLPESVPPAVKLGNGTMQGTNDFRKTGYGGPCPPSGTHRYFFRLYALDTRLAEDKKMTKRKLLHDIEGHILASCELIGIFSH